MSLLNIWLSPERALVGIDTQGVQPDGNKRPVSKCFYLAHSNLLIAGRGLPLFSRFVFDLCHFHSIDYDDAVENIEQILVRASEMLESAAAHEGVAEKVDLVGQQVALIGWSDARNAFFATMRTRFEAKGKFVETPIQPWVASPYDAAWGDPPECDMGTAIGMETMARWQVNKGRSAFSADVALGGRLLLAELTVSGATIRTQCDLDNVLAA